MILKQIFSYASFSIAASGIGFLTSIYLAKVIRPADLGVVGLFQAFLYFTVPSASFSGVGLVSINKVSLFESEFQNFANEDFTLGIVISLLILVISGFFIPFYMVYLWMENYG